MDQNLKTPAFFKIVMPICIMAGLASLLAGCASFEPAATGSLATDDPEFALPAYSQKLASLALGLGMDTPLNQILADPAAKQVLVTYDPDLALSPDVGMAGQCSLNFLAHFPQTGLTPDRMSHIERDLRDLATRRTMVRK
jgi:hypothetical protein